MLKLGKLQCDMKSDCGEPVSMLDNKGFGYCARHGLQRREHGTPCRKLRSWEVKKLTRGESLNRY
jgi:hypothetical protein